VLVTGARRVLVLLLVVALLALALLLVVGAALATLPLVLSLLLAVGAALATLLLVLSLLLAVGAALATLLLVLTPLVGATLMAATGALVVAVASWFIPKATQPPSVPTRAALAIADLSFAASRGRRLVSRGFISMLLLKLPVLGVSRASTASRYQGDIQFRRRWRWDGV
jgi:hypothetical protein